MLAPSTGGGGIVAKAAPKADANALKSAIATQLLATANDNSTSTYTTGHAGYTISHAADRAAADKRFSGYQKDTKKATANAVKAITGRNADIRKSYTTAKNDTIANATAANKALTNGVTSETNGVNAAAAALGLTEVPQVGNTDAGRIAAIFSGQNSANAQADAALDVANSRTARERNNATADSFRYGGIQQKTALDATLESVLKGLQDQTVASTLATHTSANVSEAQKLSALGQLRYLDKDTASESLAQQKLNAQLGGTTSSTTKTVNKNGSTTTVTRKK